ncbi:hypothetical protein [Methanobrevibacter sp. DSM 116169]|uniref:hypothetical protein n=1 Tax=Methanobrevibacter sp. DSM 116169 TaxID=3242727 RepID=UPI0038FBF3FD
MILKENTGQIAIEFIFLISLIIILSLISINFIESENELNIALLAAKEGIVEGIMIDSSAIYPKSSYDDYEEDKPNLLKPNSIQLNKIIIKSSEYDSKYNKTKIQLQVHVTSETVNEKKDQDSLGDRINFNLRKAISETYNTSDLTNSLYNPSHSNKYIFTTANVVWS